MTSPDTSRAVWRKSSYSGNGGDCVEITTLDAAAWRKSKHSGNNGGECVEITALDRAAWRKSTRSNNGGECVEITGTGRVIAVRDSKDPTGPHLDFTPRQWQSFVTGLKPKTQPGGSDLLT